MKSLRIVIVVLLSCLSFSSWAQITVSGKVLDATTRDPLIGVNILVRGTVLGTVTDVQGNFSLKISSAPPVTLIVTSIGYERQELEINQSNVTGLTISLKETSILGQEVVVSASRVEEKILESPVTIEKMDILQIQNTSADTYYKAIANLKGVDVATSSINFQIINARGFGNTGNTRFVQLIDGMDTQAPALNFPIGNLNGPSELDVESVELIPGASSALYGPAAFNGVLLINSKSAFDYQGLSAFAKLGVNHIGTNYGVSPSPMYEGSIRYAKAFNNKFAFKINASFMQALDWHGNDMLDRNAALNPFGEGVRNPGSDRLHMHGDEAAANLALLGIAAGTGLNGSLQALFRSNILPNGSSIIDYAFDLPNHVTSITPYNERDLIDYNAKNYKVNTGLYYRLNDKMELSYMFNGGWGTSIYTGAQRYSLSNFGITQHRLQLRGDNFYVRAYSTFENSGDSYITEFLALKLNERAIEAGGIAYQQIPRNQRLIEFLPPPSRSVNNYLVTYAMAYIRALHDGNGDNLTGLSPGQINTLSNELRTQYQIFAHNAARQFTDNLYHLDPNSDQFKEFKRLAQQGTIPNGPSFADKSGMFHLEGQYDFKNEISFMDLQVGGSVRHFNLNSQGTIFIDTAGALGITEYGAYAQAAKRVNEYVKLSGSLRYDKNQNFKGQINPRISGVFTIAKDHNIRTSYQTGFRIPTTQGQYINLDVLSSRLLGGLPEFYDFYIRPNLGRTFTGGSVTAFRNNLFATGNFDPTLLEAYTEADIRPVVPERVRSFEIGYKSLLGNKLLVDMVYFHNTFNDFITQEMVVVAGAGDVNGINPASLLSSNANNTFFIYTNRRDIVKTQGAAIGLDYSLPRNYTLSGNYTWNQFISGYDDNTLNDFNTPQHKFNVQFGNRRLTDKLGFNVTYRWQEAFLWQSSFAQGTVPAYQTVDAQISYRIPNMKSILKFGGSNILNNFYVQNLGGPDIGAIYYISLTFDEMMKR